jgi:hypothetical protein
LGANSERAATLMDELLDRANRTQPEYDSWLAREIDIRSEEIPTRPQTGLDAMLAAESRV